MEARDLRLLVVEDSDSMRKLMRSVLSRLGIGHIDEAHDGVAGLELFQMARYELVVTDLSMPNLNGMELLKAIRETPGREMTPVLMVSGHLTERILKEALDLRVDGFLAKPFGEALLVEKVNRLLLTPMKRKVAEVATPDSEARLVGGAPHQECA